MPKCIDYNGTSLSTRRSAASLERIDPSAAEDPKRLLEVIQSLCKRVSDLEASREPDYIDFVVDFDSTASNQYVILNHGFTTPIRWYVAHREFNASVFYSATNSTDGRLELYVQPTTVGKAVIRVESSKFSR